MRPRFFFRNIRFYAKWTEKRLISIDMIFVLKDREMKLETKCKKNKRKLSKFLNIILTIAQDQMLESVYNPV